MSGRRTRFLRPRQSPSDARPEGTAAAGWHRSACGDERGPGAVLGNVDAARGELRVADERLDRAAVLELERRAVPARRLDAREPPEQLLRAVVKLARDRSPVLGRDERRPEPVHEEQAVAGRRPRPLDEARAGEAPVPGPGARERAV